MFSLSRSRPAFDTSIFQPSFSKFGINFKAFATLVDLVEERARFYEALSVKIKKGSDDRYGTDKRLGMENVDQTDGTIRYRDYDKNLQNELLEGDEGICEAKRLRAMLASRLVFAIKYRSRS